MYKAGQQKPTYHLNKTFKIRLNAFHQNIQRSTLLKFLNEDLHKLKVKVNGI